MRARLTLLLTGLLIASGSIARAQAPRPAQPVRRAPAGPPNRVRVAVNAGAQTTEASFTETRTFEEFVEQGSLTLKRNIPRRPFYDGGIAVRVWKGLEFGVAASYVTDKGSGAVEARIPHPFFFDRQRAVTGQAGGIDRQEAAGHVQVAWVVPATDHFEFTLSAGPSVFAFQQVLVSNVAYTQVFPYDTAAFDHAVTELVKDTVIGYNAGVDMTWRFASHAGLGGVVRFSRGTKTLRSSNSDPIPIETGGLHAGGGLRLIF